MPEPAASVQPLTLHTGTRLVIVDVSVTDRSGHPVHGVRPSEFLVTESGKPQVLRQFQEVSTGTMPPASTLPLALPPGTFTDYAASPPSGALTVFLLDALNTTVKDQGYAIQAIERIAEHVPPGSRIAVFGLRSRLYLLQGFTSDPSALRSALHAKANPSASTLLGDAAGTNTDQVTSADIAADAITPGRTPDNNATLLAATLAQFESDDQAFQTQLRIQYTLDAFDDLGRYLQNFSGRKNLFWFSSAFPITLGPNPTAQNPFVTSQSNEDEYRETLNLLTGAQVAVYPVDARGLTSIPLYDAAHSGREFARNPTAVTSQLNAFYSSQAIEHQTMSAMAEATGGQAYYNTNDLASAIAKGMEAGSNYYSLAYSPDNRTTTGQYRRIHVSLTGELASRHYQLSYRQGYVDGVKPQGAKSPRTVSQSQSETRYARLAVSHGAPAPSDIVFKAGVRPAASASEPTVASGNRLEAASHSRGPFRRYGVDFAALPSQFNLTREPDGRRSGKIEFSAYVYNASGELVNTTGSTVDLNLTEETYKRFLADATRFHLEISMPVKGESFLRLAVHDVNSNRFGVIEVPSLEFATLLPVQPASP